MARPVQKTDNQTADVNAAQRLDKWLWFARVAKTRTLAANLVTNGRVRINRARVLKPAQTVRLGDVVTVSVPGGVRVLKISAPGVRRGPATEAATLYEEIVPLRSSQRTPSEVEGESPAAPAQISDGPGQGGPVSAAGSGRPTKKDRRVLDRLRSRGEE